MLPGVGGLRRRSTPWRAPFPFESGHDLDDPLALLGGDCPLRQQMLGTEQFGDLGDDRCFAGLYE